MELTKAKASSLDPWSQSWVDGLGLRLFPSMRLYDKGRRMFINNNDVIFEFVPSPMTASEVLSRREKHSHMTYDRVCWIFHLQRHDLVMDLDVRAIDSSKSVKWMALLPDGWHETLSFINASETADADDVLIHEDGTDMTFMLADDEDAPLVSFTAWPVRELISTIYCSKDPLPPSCIRFLASLKRSTREDEWGRRMLSLVCEMKTMKLSTTLMSQVATARSPEVCSVCLDHVELGQHFTVLPCHHMYHSTCVKEWMNTRSPTCPICRRIPPAQ